MGTFVARAQAHGVQAMAFGDLFLADIRAYREKQLAGTGIAPLFPLWKRDTRKLAAEMIDGGLVAHVTCVDPRKLDREFAGRRFDQAFLADLRWHRSVRRERRVPHICQRGADVP